MGYRHIQYDTKEYGIRKIDDNITFIKTVGKRMLTFGEWAQADSVLRAHDKYIKKFQYLAGGGKPGEHYFYEKENLADYLMNFFRPYIDYT